MRHGNQKWKARGRIGRDGSQSWDRPKACFHGCLAENLVIAAKEVRRLGKQVLLGSQKCDILSLFSPGPLALSVNLNTSGSLKLSLLVLWR